MAIMTRVSNKVFDVLGDSNDWVRGLHCRCDIDEENVTSATYPKTTP